jgi:hypothetical protein
MDNFSYHSRQKDKPSSGYEVKKEIVAGLEKREIMCDNTMRKSIVSYLVEAS